MQVAAVVVVALALVACGGDVGSSPRTDAEAEQQSHSQCKNAPASPLQVDELVDEMRRHGFTVASDPDSAICSAEDVVAVLDNGGRSQRETKPFLGCVVRERPLYPPAEQARPKVMPGEVWVAVENVECTLYVDAKQESEATERFLAAMTDLDPN